MRSIRIPYLNQLLDIRIFIALFFLLGLENIMLPILDAHDWRQTLTLSIAENFLDHPNIFFPRTDIGGATEGIMACEFPAFNYILSIIYRIFGVHDWYGRLLNWSIACAGLWFFYALCRRLSNGRAAAIATIALAATITFEYARKPMPDTFALFVTLAGVWAVWTYLESGKTGGLVAGALLIAVGVSSKIPFCIPVLFLIDPLSRPEIAKKLKINAVVGVGLAGIWVAWWYFFWMPYLLEHYHNQLIWPYSLSEGWKIVMEEKVADSWRVLVDEPFHFRPAFLCAVMGLGVLLTVGEKRLKWIFPAYMALFFYFVLKTGIVFPTHEYYVISLTPMLAFCFGYFFDRLGWKNMFIALGAGLMLYFGFSTNKRRSFTPGDAKTHYLYVGDMVRRFVPPGDKLMVNTGAFNPTLMYFTGYQGWACNADVLEKSTWIQDFKEKDGLDYILIDRQYADQTLPYQLLYEDAHFRLYKP
jgi:4-amino-4-deoxy-L-arabinose transferase-like glycosyltransferase